MREVTVPCIGQLGWTSGVVLAARLHLVPAALELHLILVLLLGGLLLHPGEVLGVILLIAAAVVELVLLHLHLGGALLAGVVVLLGILRHGLEIMYQFQARMTRKIHLFIHACPCHDEHNWTIAGRRAGYDVNIVNHSFVPSYKQVRTGRG